MIVVDVIVILILILSLIEGLTEGAVKSFFSLMTLIIALPVTGVFYHIVANVLTFLPNENWQGFFGFLISLAIISVIFHFVLFLPRKFIELSWLHGAFYRIIGSLLAVSRSAIGLIVFLLLIHTYPFIELLKQITLESYILQWLAAHSKLIQLMLPELFHLPFV